MARSRATGPTRAQIPQRGGGPRAPIVQKPLQQPPAPLTPTRPPPVQGTPDDPGVMRLTARVKSLLSQGNGGDARTRVTLGGLLSQVRDKLDHGQWLGWLEGTVPFTARSAQNYIELAGWAQASPDLFEQVATLGASKVYLMSKLSPGQLQQLLAKPDHLVPGTNRRTTLDLMKYAEFMKVMLHATRPMPPPIDPIVALLADARSSANKTIKLIKLLINNKQALDQDATEDLHDDMIVALQKLSQAFKLD